MNGPLAPGSTRTWLERYDELTSLGVAEWEIAKRLNVSIASLARMLIREGRTPSPLLAEMAKENRRKRA